MLMKISRKSTLESRWRPLWNSHHLQTTTTTLTYTRSYLKRKRRRRGEKSVTSYYYSVTMGKNEFGAGKGGDEATWLLWSNLALREANLPWPHLCNEVIAGVMTRLVGQEGDKGGGWMERERGSQTLEEGWLHHLCRWGLTEIKQAWWWECRCALNVYESGGPTN